MKKFVSLIAAMFLIFSLAACNNKGEVKEQLPDEKREETAENGKNNKSDTKKEGKEVSAFDLLSNIHARRAIAMAIDKNHIAENIMGDGSLACNYMVPKSFAFDENNSDFRDKYPDGFLAYNPEEAKKEWAIAKEELDFNEVELEFLTFNSEDSKIMCEYIQSQLSANLDGIKLILNQQPFNQKTALSARGKYHVEFSGWGPDYPDPMTFLEVFASSNGNNHSGYVNPEYDKIIADATSGDLAVNPQKRWEALQDAEKMLLEDALVIPLYQSGIIYIQKPHVKGIQRHSFASDYSYKNATTDVQTDGLNIIKILALGDFNTLDNNKVSDQTSFEILGSLMEGLVTLGENDAPMPGIAESWDISEDGKVYTFKLRNAVWSNGDPITAQDFVDSWRRLANPETGSIYSYIVEAAGVLNAADVISGKQTVDKLGIEALDTNTLRVTLSQPVPYFLKMMSLASFYPINLKFINEMGENYASGPDTLVYSGPYILTQRDMGYGYSLRKNPSYWDVENVKNDGLDFRLVKEVAAAVSMYDNGELDRCYIGGEYAEQRKNTPDFVQSEDTSIFYLIFNINNK